MAGDASRKNGRKGGRPTALTEELVSRAERYASEVESEKITVRFGVTGDGRAKWAQTAPKLPNVARLAVVLGISRETVYALALPRDRDDGAAAGLRRRFSDTVARIQAMQEAMLQENGTAGTFNAHMSKFLLASKHGHTERVDHTSGGRPISPGANPFEGTPEHDAAVGAYHEKMRELLTKRKGQKR